MSLINEALKRTHNASRESAAPRLVSVERRQTTNDTGTTSVRSRSGIVLTVAIALPVIAAINLFVWHSILPREKGSEQLPPVSHAHRATVSPPSAPVLSTPSVQDSRVKDSPRQVQADNPPGTKAAAPVEIAENELVARLLAKIKAEQATAAARALEPPRLVLQGVTRQGNSREAMINGYNVREGDEIEGARVVAIEARSVKLRFGERDLVLRMP